MHLMTVKMKELHISLFLTPHFSFLPVPNVVFFQDNCLLKSPVFCWAVNSFYIFVIVAKVLSKHNTTKFRGDVLTMYCSILDILSYYHRVNPAGLNCVFFHIK